MEIKVVNRDGVTLVALLGNLDGNTAPEVQEKLEPLVEAKCCLILDLIKCGYVSSAGLRVLLMLAKHLTAQEGRLALIGVCPEIKDVMEMTGFINFFELHDTIEEVLKTK
ncbi:MAG: STAS domain-containing protein [Candidatus Omnitrophota bacterium]|jgi:anti-anti-sigma factor